MSVLERETGKPLFPSWSELLKRAAKRLEDEQKSSYAGLVRHLLAIEKPDYLDAARRAREGLGAVWFAFLKEQLDHSQERVDETSLALARSIWKLGAGYSSQPITIGYCVGPVHIQATSSHGISKLRQNKWLPCVMGCSVQPSGICTDVSTTRPR